MNKANQTESTQRKQITNDQHVKPGEISKSDLIITKHNTKLKPVAAKRYKM